MQDTRKPKAIVFDLDYTLWPFYVDTHFNPPFSKKDGRIIDAYGAKVKCYPEVPDVLKQLHGEGYVLGIASRTSEIAGANQLVELFGWSAYFTHRQIFPGRKISHFNKIKKDSGLGFDEMIFFDDESRNIVDVSRGGTLSILVEHGVNFKIVTEGLKRYAEKYK